MYLLRGLSTLRVETRQNCAPPVWNQSAGPVRTCLRQAQLAGHRDQICSAQTRTVRLMQAISQISRATKVQQTACLSPFLTFGMAAPQDLLIPSVPKSVDQIPSTNSGPPNSEITDPKMCTMNHKYFITTDVHYHRNVPARPQPH